MRDRRRIYIGFVTAAVLTAGLFLSGCSSKPDTGAQTETVFEEEESEKADAQEETAPTGEDIISFQAATLEGETVDESILSGKKLTMINVWATYCSPCIGEMPELGEIAEEYANKNVQIVGIVSDVQEGDDVSTAKELVDETGADYTHLLLNQQVYMTFLSGVTAVPTTVFVDEEGNQVGERYVGAKSKEEWVEIIESLLQ